MPYVVVVRGKVRIAGEVSEENLVLARCCVCVFRRGKGNQGVERPWDEEE